MSGRGLTRRPGESVCAPTSRNGDLRVGRRRRGSTRPVQRRAPRIRESGTSFQALPRSMRLEAGGAQPVGRRRDDMPRRRRRGQESIRSSSRVITAPWNRPMGKPVPRRCDVSLMVTIGASAATCGGDAVDAGVVRIEETSVGSRQAQNVAEVAVDHAAMAHDGDPLRRDEPRSVARWSARRGPGTRTTDSSSAVPLPVDHRVIARIVGRLELLGRDVVGGEPVALGDALARLHLQSDGARRWPPRFRCARRSGLA